jgi:hypothetical protein
MGRVVCAAAERALKSDLNQQGFLFESSIVTVNHFDYTANGGGFRATQLRELGCWFLPVSQGLRTERIVLQFR